mmetsp:Transcript_1334/g.4598  ORF Transcript_1334/g.4598 Transcript_1334/m.4598 type:complete len:372 (-) Transcript_1334:297-1412(-)
MGSRTVRLKVRQRESKTSSVGRRAKTAMALAGDFCKSQGSLFTLTMTSPASFSQLSRLIPTTYLLAFITLLTVIVPQCYSHPQKTPNPPTRISGGTEASPSEFPFAVAIASKNSKWAYCGGSLISESLILTAAHCMYTGTQLDRAGNIGVVAGYTRISDGGVVNRELRAVSRYWVHPEYVAGDLSRNANDLAILELREPIEASSAASPITLLDSAQNYTVYESKDTSLIVQGWGSTPNADSSDVLLKADIQLFSQVRCAILLNDAGYRSSQMLCGAGSSNKDACPGDSGSALLAKDGSGRNIAVGLVSYGIGDCGDDSVGGYVRVSAYLDYIRGVMKGDFEPTVSGASMRNSGRILALSVGFVLCVTLLCG